MSIINVIQWNGPPSVMAWRYPNGEIMAGSQLVVREHQHAVLMKEGRMLGPFLPGRHTLSTKNLPVLKSLVGLVTGGDSPFTAEVWFVNRTVDLNVRWGTATPIQVKDPEYGIMIPVLGYGMLGVTVADTKRFLLKIAGALPAYERENVESHFRGILLSSIKSHIAKALLQRKLSILDIAAHIRDLSDDLQAMFKVEFGDYGLGVEAFRIESITTREDDPAVARLRHALARRAEMRILGTDFAQTESFEVMKRAASNEGGAVGPFIGAGLGLGMGAAVGGQAGAMAGHLASNPGPQAPRCAHCGAPSASGAKFCTNCGMDPSGAAVARCACGAGVPQGAKFCPACGAVAAIKCEKCGFVADADDKFCGGCGVAVARGGGEA